MDDRFTPRPVAGWYTPAAIASLLFMLLGCAMYLMYVNAELAALPADQRLAYEAEPRWVTAAYALAVWPGLVGALLLLLRRKPAELFLLVSMVGAIVWLAGLLLVPQLRDALSTNDYVVAIVVTILTWTIYWFARHSRQRGWLR